jgi:energy-coupling factor transport system permease protein
MRDSFTTYHPFVNFIYFTVIVLVSIFFLHPVLLLLSLFSGAAYFLCLKGKKKLIAQLPFLLMVFLLPAIINPLFNHQGMTLLFYLKNGNPITLESILYGLGAGVMMAVVLLWFGCFHEVMTSDKLMQLTGKSLPAVSLLFTMTLRFVPEFTTQMKKTAEAQKCVGIDVSSGNLITRIRHGLRVFSITLTWAFEHSIETADSMKSRGYALPGRSQFTRYRFDRRDSALLIIIMGLSLLFFGSLRSGQLQILYFPVFTMNTTSVWAMIAYGSYAILCFLPVILHITEEITWKYTRSKI